MDIIFLHEVRIDTLIGVYEWERQAPQTLQLDMELGIPDSRACQTDNIADTIDYAQVIERLRAELAVRQFNLIETLGEFVVKLLFDEFGAPWVKLAIAKMGVMKGVKRVGVFIQRGRNGSAPPEHAPTAGLPG